VVPATTPEGVLRSLEVFVPDLEHRVCVVIEATHEARVDLRRDPCRRQSGLHVVEETRAVRAERLLDHWRRLDQVSVLLAVQQPQRIALQTALAVIAQPRAE